MHKGTSDEIGLLSKSAADFGIRLSQHELEMFRVYLDELWEWNRHINLTGLSSRERILIELFLDSLIPVPYFPEEGSMLDVGSGAGIPGLPIKILNPSLKIHLLEPNSRKVSFLKQVARLLKLKGIEIHRGRIEKDRRNLNAEGYRIMTAKALGPLGETIQYCVPFLTRGGILACFLGARAESELERTEEVREKCGLMVFKIIRYALPGKLSERNTVLLKKKA